LERLNELSAPSLGRGRSLSNILVSIVDDDESVRLSIASLVRSLGARALTFSSANSFLDSDAVMHSTCIVSDIDMPSISGLDMQSMLRQRGSSTPVIFVTASSSDSQRSAAMSNGAICYLEKPVDARAIEALALAINSYLLCGKNTGR
jgi:FixJ family two-component response regulator